MIALRAAVAADASAIAAIYAPHVLAGTVSFEIEPPDAGIIAARMAASGGLYPWIVATDPATGGILGYAYATRFAEREAYRWVVETTIYVADDAQGRGVGRRLYRTLLDTLQAQGFAQAIGRIALPNPGSIALHKALGFHEAGVFHRVGYKHGQWIDVGYWQRPLAEPALPPREPLRVAEVGVVQG